MKKSCMPVLIAISFLILSCGDGGIESSGSRYEQTSWLYRDDTVREIRITINPDYLNNIVMANYTNSLGEKEYALAYSISIDGETTTNIGIRSRGNTSSHNWKRQFKISFDCTNPLTNASAAGHMSFPEYDDRRFRGTKKLNLRASQNDPTILREKTASYIMQQAGATAPRIGFARVYINEIYWGLYLVVEQIDKTFLDSHLREKSGNLYKGEYLASFVPGNEHFFDLKTNKDLNDTSGLTAMFNGLAAATTAAQAAQYFDLQNVMNYYAAATLAGHWDSYAYLKNNDYLYHHSDGKFRIVTWDMDNTFGSDWSTASSLESSIYQMRDNENYQALFKKVLDDPVCRTQYQSKIRSLLDSTFNTTHLFAKIDSWKNTIQSAVLSGSRKRWDWGASSLTEANSWWEQGFDRIPDGWPGKGYTNNYLGLKSWIAGRIARVKAELDSTAPLDSDGNTSFTTAQVITKDNPAFGGITGDVDSDFFAFTVTENGFYQISMQNLTGDFTLELYDSAQTLVTNSSNSGTTDETFGTSLSTGTYYLKVSPIPGQTGSYTVNYGTINSIEVAATLGTGFEDRTATWGYWTLKSGTVFTVNATASDTNTAITNVQLKDWNGNPWINDSTAPYQLSSTLNGSGFLTLSVTAFNNAGQTRSTTLPKFRLYSGSCTDPQDNGDGTFTFRLKPEDVGLDTSYNFYLAGDMNGWPLYTVANQLTNRGDGILTITCPASSGQRYKFTVDYNRDGIRDDFEWFASPANPYQEETGHRNSIIP